MKWILDFFKEKVPVIIRKKNGLIIKTNAYERHDRNGTRQPMTAPMGGLYSEYIYILNGDGTVSGSGDDGDTWEYL